jgi:tetratricopeptide (TPR) repeat protein
VSDEQIRSLLQRADQTAGAPSFGPVSAAGIRTRAHRTRLIRIAAPVAAAAALLIATAVVTLRIRPQPSPPQTQQIASLQEKIEQLQTQTDATLRLVQEVVERDRQERRVAALEAELASIPDPMQEIDRHVDETAFVLLYQADKLYKELNRTESAVAAYKEVIQLFPKNRWADVARERLSEIEQRQINKSDEGEAKCERPNA